MKTKPILTLVALTTVLPELFSGSTPLPSFLLRPGLVLFLALGYGVSVLLVRELWIRCGGGLLGLFLMGLGYSLFNEGLLAKTLIVDHNLPINQYDHYGYWLGLSYPWMATIGVWHACASVLFPIVLTHHFFPEAAPARWVKGWLAVTIAALFLFLGSSGFLHPSEKGVTGTPAQLVELFGLMLMLFGLGCVFRGRPPGREFAWTRKSFPLGFSVIVPFWAFIFLAADKVPAPLFFLALAAVVLFYAWQLRRRQWLALPALAIFGLGWYLHNVLQAVLFIGVPAGEPVRALATLLVDLLILVVLFRGVRSRLAPSEVPTVTPA